jgi:hypothetical protein
MNQTGYIGIAPPGSHGTERSDSLLSLRAFAASDVIA